MKPKKIIKNTLGRREFLATMGAGTAILANPFAMHGMVDSSIIPSPLKAGSSDRLGAAVIGLGLRGRGMATWQMPAYADVLAICDIDLRKVRSVAEGIYKITGGIGKLKQVAIILPSGDISPVELVRDLPFPQSLTWKCTRNHHRFDEIAKHASLSRESGGSMEEV